MPHSLSRKRILIRFTDDYRHFRFRETLDWDCVSEDELNFYLHGWTDEWVPGFWSNYLVIPKSVAKLIEE